jgi:hypothetical protein
MAQTKRKRRTKHRGNAAGTIESRGRTGRKPTAQERKGAAPVREDRRFVEPSWKSSATRAGIASVLLFGLFQLGLAGEKQTFATSAILAIGAFALYTPLGYKLDRIFWERRMRKAGRAIPPKQQKKR